MTAWTPQWQRKRKGKGRRKVKSFVPYRSGLEKRVAVLLHTYHYEPKSGKVEYMVPHRYTPDFVHPDNPDILIEVKGYFRTSSESRKYICVKRDNPHKELIFLFQDPYKRATPNCRPRKDGSVMTLAEWANKYGFLFYSVLDIPAELARGDIDMAWIRKQKEERGVKC